MKTLQKAIYYTILLFGICNYIAFAQSSSHGKVVKVIENDKALKNLNSFVYILEDSSGKLTLDQIRSSRFQKQFTPFSSFGRLMKEKTYWAKITFQNLSDRNHWVLSTGIGDYIRMYILDNQGKIQQKINGQLVSLSKRDLWNHVVASSYKFNIKLPKNTHYTVFFKFTNKYTSTKLKMGLSSPQKHFQKEAHLKIIQSIFQGALLIILLYNLVLFLVVKDRTYLYYSAYILNYSLYYLIYNGFLVITPELPIYIGLICLQLSMVFYFQFMKFFVDAKKLVPNWNKVINYWIKIKALFVVVIIGILFFRSDLAKAEIYILLVSSIDGILLLITCYVLLRSGSFVARYFIIGSFFLVAGIALSNLNFLKVLSISSDENFFSQVGIFLELVLFSVGLGYRERKNEQDKRLAEEENARILEEQNVTLEKEVYKRTQEIRDKNHNLEEKQAQILAQNDVLKQKQEEIAYQNTQLAEQHELISHAHELLSKAHKNIKSSIQAGLRIQKAVLPFKERMQKTLPTHFVFYRPRDVVSGDFYWFEEVQGKQYIVAADCTGHGIPGAFMTMLCIQALNTVVLQQHIYTPEKILNRLNIILPEILKTQKTSVRDGMDVAICVIDKEKQEINYAGAQSPLVVIQNQNLNLIKGDMYGINGHRRDDEIIQYTLHTIDVSQPTSLYMFSDGIKDQFGGEQGRKFSSKRLKNLLVEMSTLPTQEQNDKLEASLNEWMKDQDQIDDMLLIGIQIS